MPGLAYSPYVWQFAGSFLVTAALGLYARRLRQVPAATTFAAAMAALSYWTFCYGMELLSATLPGKVFWASAKYPGSTAGPALWLVLSLELTGRERWLTRGLRAGLAAFVVVTTAVVWTNGLHHWFWRSIQLVPGEPETQAQHGFFFVVYATGLYGFILASVAFYVDFLRRAPAWYRRQAITLAVGAFIPLGGRMLEDFAGIDLFPHVDNVILLLLAAGLFFALAMFRFGALDIVHIGHHLVIQNIQAGIVVLDPRGRVVELNPYAARLARLSDRAAIGQPYESAFEGWPAPRDDVPQELEMEDGRAVQVQTSPILGSDGVLAGHAVVMFDITARKAAERQLEEQARLQVEVERMARHDLKTPLNTIIALPQLLREDPDMPARHLELLLMVERAGYRVLEMVNLSLDLLKMERGTYAFEPQPVDLGRVLRRVAFDLQRVAASRQVAIDVPNDGPSVQGDELLSYSMLANLFKNAVEAAPAGGRVAVATRTTGAEVEIAIRTPGVVPAEVRDRFFEKFSTAGKPGGTGLGNYSARLMAETQRGRIAMETSEAAGTTVRVVLPAAATAPVPAPVAPVPRGEHDGVIRVLLVEDDPITAAVLEASLAGPSVQVAAAADGREGLRRVEAFRPDVVFVDYQMPGMNGPQMVARLREAEGDGGRRAFVVGLTGHDDAATADSFRGAGCDRVLVKPVEPEDLRAVVAMARR